MKKIKMVVVFVLGILIFGFLECDQFGMKKVRSIGDDRNDFTFFKITAALITPEKEIYIGDSGGHFLSKYNWAGEFMGRTGEKGQGPADINMIHYLKYYKKNIYFFDTKIFRVSILSGNLKPVGFINTKRYIRGNMFILNSNSILCTFGLNMKQGYRIGKIDLKGRIINLFFNKTQFGEFKKQKDELEWAIRLWTSKLKSGYSYNKGEIIVSYEYPKNPVEFIVYDHKGSKKRSFFYYPDKKYQFPKYKLSYPLKIPKNRIHYLILSSLFSYKNFYIAFFKCKSIKKSADNYEKFMYLVFNRQGKLLAEKPMKDDMEFFNLTRDGYLIGKKIDDTIPKAIIYKLNF